MHGQNLAFGCPGWTWGCGLPVGDRRGNLGANAEENPQEGFFVATTPSL